MSENMDLVSNNICIPEDAFDHFQAISMYQEEQYITLTEVGPTKPKDPDPGELSHLSYDNEVVVTTENEVNSTVNESIEEMESSEQQTLDDSGLETNVIVNETKHSLDHDFEPQNIRRKGRMKKHVINDTMAVSNNSAVLGTIPNSSVDIQIDIEPESPIISSSVVPRKRGRKPKPKPVLPVENSLELPDNNQNKEISNISITPFSSDPESIDTISAGVKRRRGRPRKVSVPNEHSSELSGSDNSRIDNLSSSNLLTPVKGRRGRPRKVSLETNIDSQIKHHVETSSNDLISMEDLNVVELNKSPNSNKSRKDSIELELMKMEQMDTDNKPKLESDSKIVSDISVSENDDLDDISLSKLKSLPDSSNTADEYSTEDKKDHNATNISSENINLDPPPNPSINKGKPKKLRKSRPKKGWVATCEQSDPIIETAHDVVTTSTDVTHIDNTQIDNTLTDNDDTEDLSLSKLKEIKHEAQSTEINNTPEIATTETQIVEVENSTNEVNGTLSKRNTKMPVMSDFEYNIDSVLGNETSMNEDNADNSLLVEDTSKRPIRRKVPTMRYDEESDEDPFANVELSDDDEPRGRKGNRCYSDDEYIPGRRGNKDIDSTDSEANELLDEAKELRRKKFRKRSDNQSPRKKSKNNESNQDLESDIEIIPPPSEIKANDDSQSQPMQSWGSSNEFENFLAKKIQGTSLKIKKVSSTEPTDTKALEIPMIDPKQAKKTIEMCSQTNIINTVSTAMQTSTPYDIPMKENITLTPEQSTKACNFLHSIVKTTSELGTLMTQKSEDFIKKKINTTHVTDTMKMDYCVKKSFLLFKLAKHNLMQMEEDLAKQYDEFLKTNGLEGCREVPKAVVPSAKPASSDSDCEIVEEPVKATASKKFQDKPKFNPKTVFLNKELSIKIAKKPAENKNLLKDIKGRHTVWINDTVMVKKVKPTQSFLAQDSRNKKPPDNNITTKMVSDFFKNYYRKKALSVCAPFITTDWLNVNRECLCNYFVVKPVQFNNDVTHSENGGISMNSTASNASASETNRELKAIKHIANTIVTCPEPLFKLCFRIVKSQMHDLNHVKEVCQHIQNELTDGKNEPVTLFRLCLRALTATAVDITERRPTSPEIITSDDTLKITALPLKLLCHRKIVALLSNASQKDSREKPKDDLELRCSTEELTDYIPTHSPKYISPSSNIRNGIKSLLYLCVEFIQRKQVLDTHNSTILLPKSLKSIAFGNIKQLLYGNLREYLLDTSQLNLNQHNDGIMIEGLTINSVNTLSEEAFLNLEQSHADIPDSSEYLDDFDNEDHFESDFNEPEEDNQTETNWVSQVQMKELRSCLNTSNSDVNQDENVSIITKIKLEPLDDMPENIVAPAHVKSELVPGLEEMTVIPDIKPEVAEQLSAVPLQRQDSDSYDVDAFEQFVSSNKIMHEQNIEDIFSQSALRVRRQHEPDYDEEYDTSMSLLVPQTYEPLTIENVKGNLMESSSDEESSRTKKVTGKKKPDKRNKGKQKKPDPKTYNKDAPTLTKEKVTNNEVATLTRRMRDRIRQEEKKDDSSDSGDESLPLRLRSRKEQEKSKQAQNNKAKESEIQCNNVDSTDQVDEDVANFTGFAAVDQSDISRYQEYMKCVLEKIIPDKEEDNLKKDYAASKQNRKEEPEAPVLNPDEPVELLECEPTMPIFDDIPSEKRPSRRNKGKFNMLKKEEIVKKDEVPKEEDIAKEKVPLNKEDISIEETSKESASFIDRHGWQCYPVNTEDSKLYQSACIALEKLPESFVQTYFEYQGIVMTNKDENDEEIDRLTNLNSLNRTAQLNIRAKIKSKREAEGEHTAEKTSEAGSRLESPTFSDHYDELEPSDDEGAKVEDEVAPSVAQKSTENTLAKNLLMNDNDSDSDETSAKVKQESMDDTVEAKRSKPSSKPKKKVDVVIEDGEDLMLTADKMMNKELTLLHAPIVLTDDVKHTPAKGPVTRNKQKSASKNPSTSTKTQNEEDSSSEEEKQWVTTKEKLLKRLGRKEGASIDDAKRAKLVSEFIERRGYLPDSHIRSKARTKTRGSGKKFLERQKQLRVLSRELFGESSDAMMSKRSQKAQASLLYKGRRNIRKVIDKKSLARSTVVANMDEFERKRRLNARQTKLRELLGCEEGVNVLVINDEVCLEYNFELNRPVVTIHPFFTKVMKAHQYEGVKFMWDACFESLAEIASGHPGGGCILAHCMGLGKTLQVLALLHTVLTHPGVRMQRVLVCCPLSTVLNWVDEIHKWIGPVTNKIKVFELSKLKKTYERAYQLEDWYNGGGIFIIGYELFRSLTTLDPFLDDVRPTIVNKIRSALLDPGPDIIVCDEGHLLKNDCSVLAVAMSRVVTRRRIVLTGTPMQNNLREYYCMVNFVKPNLLGTYSEYSNRFENPIMNGQHRDSREEDIKLMKARTHILHKVLEGCLQRQEASVLYPYLPKKYEYTVFITLTQCQWDLYKHYLYHYGKTSKQSILKDFHILQKIWSHPQVLHNFQTKARDRDEKNRIKALEIKEEIAAEKLEDDLATEDLEEIKPNATEDLWWLDYLDGGNMLETLDSSNKFVTVFRILDECIALGDKVLIFSTSLFCLDALEYFLKKINKWSLGQEYFRLDGSVPAEVRQKWCREFNADHNYKTKLFLVSTRAGCLGLNMTAANRVIIMDTSWNPAHDIQSIFRVYRFGQKKDCFIYRLVAMGTMEQKIYERSVTKQAVACRVVDEQQIDRHYNMADLTELYKFDEAGASVVGGVAVGVHDVALLRVARLAALHAVHEHDSLLRGSSEQGLPEHERNAAWMQFQQEQAHKQMENKLILSIPHIPKISLKRLHGHEYAASTAALTPDIKTEDNSDDYKPNGPKTKKGKKSPFIKCSTPIQDTGKPLENLAVQPESKYYTRGRPRKDASLAKPGTSKEIDVVTHQASKEMDVVTHQASKEMDVVTHQDIPAESYENEIMVEKITDILIKHNFQSRKGNTEISNLVARVRNMVKKGYVNDDDQSDDLTASIAKILLPKQMPLPVVTDIMCESINNSVAPFGHREEDAEVITSDPTPRNFILPMKTNSEPELRAKRKAAIAAEKSIASDGVINLDDDDWDSRDADFVPEEESHSEVNNKGKKKAEFGNVSHSRLVDDDESTLSADSCSQNIDIDYNTNIRTTERTSNNIDKENNISSLKQASNTKKPKDRTIKINSSKEINLNHKPWQLATNKTIESKPTTSKAADKEDWNGILLSDDDEAISSLQTTEVMREETFTSTPEKPPEKPPESTPEKCPESDEIVPLPTSLLKNQNFINIVAHTYLVGNPMLDEDAATLAAQYSTLKALNEAEQTGKDVCSGPIYDIAVKVIGKEVLKKMHSVNPKAASSSADAAAANIQRKEQMIASEKSSSGSDSSAKAKLRYDMIKEKLGLQKTVEHVPASVAATPIVATIRSKVVPVGLIKTAAGMANESFGQPRVESILPDDDEVVMSDDLPAPPVPPVQQPPTRQSNNPIILNHTMPKPRKLVVHPVRVTVGNSYSAPTSLPESPKVIIQPYRTRNVQPTPSIAVMSATNTPPLQAPPAAAPVVAERILPNDETICLDSDDEDSITPHAQPSLQPAPPAPPAAPVPVSLTMAHAPGVKLPLPAMAPMPNFMPLHQLQTTQKQMLVLRQVVTKDGVQPKYVLIPSNQLPLPKDPTAELQNPSSAQPQVASTFQAMPGESVLSPRKFDIGQTISKTLCKSNDIIKITHTGQIEVINRSEMMVATPAPPPPAVAVAALQPRQIAPMPSSTASIDLTDVPTEVEKPRPVPAKHFMSASVDLTNIHFEVAKPRPVASNHSTSASVDLITTYPHLPTPTYLPDPTRPTATSRLIGPRPSTSASVDLTDVSIEHTNQKALAPKPAAAPKPAGPQIETYKNQTKVAARKTRRISSSSSSSSSGSSPENPLSILRDVVHIRAADYPPTSAAPTPSNSKSIILRTEKCTNSNISVQHVVSTDSKNTVANAMKSFTTGSLKLTKVPKNKVPKYVDTAVEKQIKKDALIKRITPLLTNQTVKIQPKPKEEPKPRGKNTINFDTFNSTTNSRLKSNTVSSKPANKKSEVPKFSKASGSKTATMTVDLTDYIPPGTTVSKTKVDVKKRMSSVVETNRMSSVVEPTPAKKKKTQPMTLKDFNLDDIDDIIELD